MMETDRFTDVGGLRVGHAEDAQVRTGTTVILPDAPVVAGVDVRGGAPGTRDTDALNPACLVERVHGFVLSGGSVFGLGAADGVTGWLSERGIGLPIAGRAVPVLPSAILFDLANGGDKQWGNPSPYPALGIAACDTASPAADRSGAVGAGFGARAGDRPGGIGSTSARHAGWTVGALIAVNSFGIVCPEAPPLGPVPLPKMALPGQNTTIGLIATNAPLSRPQCQRLAMMAHDGLARSIRPVHTLFDGDTLFACSTTPPESPPVDALTLSVLGTLAADCVVRAVRRAVGLG